MMQNDRNRIYLHMLRFVVPVLCSKQYKQCLITFLCYKIFTVSNIKRYCSGYQQFICKSNIVIKQEVNN